jgi:glucuronide carrier protein
MTITTIAFAVVGFALYLFTFFTSREQVERGGETAGLRETLGMLRRNRPLIVLCLSCLLFLTGMFAMQTVTVYLFDLPVIGGLVGTGVLVVILVQSLPLLVGAIGGGSLSASLVLYGRRADFDSPKG